MYHSGMERIQDLWHKIKGRLDYGLAEWGLYIVVILACLAAFALGRLSALVDARPLVALGEAPQAAQVAALAAGGQYVASKTGEVYYFPWCAGTQKILPANQRWFNSEAAAQKAGYRPAKNCKGLVGK